MAKPPTEKNEKLKKEMLTRVTPEQAEKFEARKKIKADLLDAIYAGDLAKVKSLKDNKWGVEIGKLWWKKGKDPRVKVDMDGSEIAAKLKKEDIAGYLKGLV